MPTEEVFTTPDARRVDGTVRSTYPLQIQGTVVRGLEIRFEGGRAVEVRAEEGDELMRAHVAADDGAARLGEVALVDGTRVSDRRGSSSTTRCSTRTPRRTSRSVLRSSSASAEAAQLSPEERHARGINHSSIHTDFMIGSPELAVSGVTKDGDEVPILRDGDWVALRSRDGEIRTRGLRVPNAAL